VSGRSVFVTGAYGLLGSWLTKALVADGDRVTVLRRDERVASALELEGTESQVDVVAGDLLEIGPDPAGVLRTLRSRPLTVLTGNTDRDIVEAAADDDPDEELAFALRQIGRDGVDYLARLPFSRRITPPGGTSPADDLLAVHANPHDLERKLDPEMSNRELQEVLGDVRAAVIAFGHHHVAFQRQVDDRLLIDVSAVGNPKDRDLRCRYGVLTWDAAARRWQAEHRYVDYPVAETTDQILVSGLPNPDKTLRKLLKASY